MPKTWAATTKGGYVFRNRWRDGDDIVAQVFLKSEGEGGWSHPDGGSVRLQGLGRVWADQGLGNSKAGSRWFENVVMLPDDEVNAGSRAVRTFYQADPETGSGAVSMDMNIIYSGRETYVDRKGAKRSRPLVDNTFRLLRGNLRDLGIRGMRSFGVDYSGRSGAPAAFAIVDRIAGGGRKVWMWQLATRPEDTAVSIEGGRFTIRQGGASLVGTFLAPEDVKLELASGAQDIHLKYGNRGERSLHAVHAVGGPEFFVVMTLQRGPAPEVRAAGRGLGARVTVGDLAVSFDGERIVFGGR